MPKQIKPQNSFNGGELSPLMYSRTDFKKYDSSIKTGTNYDLKLQGPISRRRGSEFIQNTKVPGASSAPALIKFEGTTTSDLHVLELGSQYARVFNDRRFDFETAMVGVNGESLISWAQRGNTIYFIVNLDKTIHTLEYNTSSQLFFYKAFVFSIPPTIETGEDLAVDITPSASTGVGVTFTAPSSAFLASDVGRQLSKLPGSVDGIASITAVASSTSATGDILVDFPNTNPFNGYLDLSPISTLTPTGTVPGSIITLTGDINTWRGQDVGKFVYLNSGVVEITVVTSNLVVSGVVLKALTATTATAIWTLQDDKFATSIFSFSPLALEFHQNRFIIGDSQGDINMSEIGFFDNFAVGSADADGIQVTISGNGSLTPVWLFSYRELFVGTTSFESSFSSTGSSLTPTDIKYNTRTQFGSRVLAGAPKQPINVSNELVFATQADTLRALRFDLDTDNYADSNLLLLAEHLVVNINNESQIVQVALVPEPQTTIYAVLDSGDMIVGIFDRPQNILGWTRYTTDGDYKRVVVAKEPNLNGYEVWVIVSRKVSGVNTLMVEVFEVGDGVNTIVGSAAFVHGFSDSFTSKVTKKLLIGATQANPVVLTSTGHNFQNGFEIKIFDVVGMTELNNRSFLVANKTTNTLELTDLDGNNIDGTGFTAFVSGGFMFLSFGTITGLDHLEGRTVEIKTDGAVHASKVVTSGVVTLDANAAIATVGIAYTSPMATLNKEFDVGLGSQQGQKTRWISPILNVVNSYPPTVNGQVLPARNVSSTMDAAVPLFSGFLYYGNIEWDEDGSLEIVSSGPFPFTLTGIFGTIDGGVT